MRRMSAGRLGAVTLLAVSAAFSQSAVMPRGVKHTPASPGIAPLTAFGGRSAEQQRSAAGAKLDAALADLSRHASRVRPGHELEDLHSLSPAARFAQAGAGAAPLVAVDAMTRGDPQLLEHALVQLGMRHPSVYSNDVGGWLPVSAISAASERTEVAGLRAAMSRTRAAAIATQGDFTQGSAALRATYPTLIGTGVTVGILSDSFNCYGVYDQPDSGVPASGVRGYAPNGFASDDATSDESNGYLTASVDVLEEASCLQYGQPLQLPFTDEGRAMLQVVHVVAPGAALAFYTSSNSEADFANGIGALAAAGATVIADDTGYFDEPFFQDGILAQAIDTVEAKGVAYFSAAGNNGQLSYENIAPVFEAQATTLGSSTGEHLLNFDTTGATTATSLEVTIPPLFPGEFLALVVEWDQPYVTGAPASPGASSQIDLCVSGASAQDTIINLDGTPVTCTGPNAIGSDAVQVLILGNSAANNTNTGTQTINLQVGLTNLASRPGRVKVVVEDDGAGSTIDSYATHSPTLQGHPGASGAVAVAAAFFARTPGCGTSPAVLESFSAEGGDPILFDTSGNRLETPEVRQKPDLTGPDGVNTSFFGFFLAGSGYTDTSTVVQCKNDASHLNFFGTSAATPHVAGAAALMLQADPAITPAQIYQNLRSSAAPMGMPVPDFESGYGFIQAEAAAAMAILPLSITTASLPAGQVGTAYSASLAARGGISPYSWSLMSGTLPQGLSLNANGTLSGTPTAATSATALTFQVTDSEKTRQTKTASLSLSVAAMPSSGGGSSGGGGGGVLEAATLLALSGIVCARAVRATRRARTAQRRRARPARDTEDPISP